MINQHYMMVWAMFFANITAMQHHPGWHKDGTHMSIAQCSLIADNMMMEYLQRFGDEYRKPQVN